MHAFKMGRTYFSFSFHSSAVILSHFHIFPLFFSSHHYLLLLGGLISSGTHISVVAKFQFLFWPCGVLMDDDDDTELI